MVEEQCLTIRKRLSAKMMIINHIEVDRILAGAAVARRHQREEKTEEYVRRQKAMGELRDLFVKRDDKKIEKNTPNLATIATVEIVHESIPLNELKEPIDPDLIAPAPTPDNTINPTAGEEEQKVKINIKHFFFYRQDR